MEKQSKQRTLLQNKAIHAYFAQLAQALNESGYDMRRTLKHDIDIPWTPETIKKFLWKPIQNAQLGKESTTELSTKDIDAVYEVLNRHLGEKLGVHVPFPSMAEIIFEQRSKELGGKSAR